MRCEVCGDEASGYYNNGGPSCSSCRVFFRRMALRKTINACVQNGQCVVNLQNRSQSCKYCRYRRCLNIGMNPHGVSGAGAIRANFVREPTGLEATSTEKTWTENALAIVSKVRISQKDVDKSASLTFGLKTGNVKFIADSQAFAAKMSKKILSGMLDDLYNLKLDTGSFLVASLWITIGSFASGNIANQIKHSYNIFPTNLEIYENVEAIDFTALFREILSTEAYQTLQKCIKKILYYSSDRDIHSMVLLSLLTGNQEEAKHLNRTLNKMLLKKLHHKYPYQGDEIIRSMQRQMATITEILPFWLERSKENEEPPRFEEVTEAKFCQHCKKEFPVFNCSKCKVVYYCNADCQTKDWPSHILVCKK